MSIEYNKYLETHIKNVQKGAYFLINNLPEILYDEKGNFIGQDLIKICSEHDNSKYTEKEYDAYDSYFYGKNKTKEVIDNFNLAWLHHVHQNPHHWQYWILMEDDPKTKDSILIEIPNLYIFEMICDWWSFSWQKENLNEIFKWYDDHKNIIKMHPNSRKKVEHMLSKMKMAIQHIYEVR